jgi:hypothetical protein
MKLQQNEKLYYTGAVEIRKQKDQYGVYSLKDIKKDDLVLLEPMKCCFVMRPKDFSGNHSDACTFVDAIYRFPDTLGREFMSFNLKAIDGVFETPPPHDRKFLQKLSKKYRKAYQHVLDTWRIVCTYHVRSYLLLSESNNLKVRLQLSTLFNRINHHCSPNSYGVCYFSSYRTFKQPIAYVKAIRDIAAGDEISYSYVHPRVLIEDVRTRQKEISDCYNFTCSCSRCESELSLLSP